MKLLDQVPQALRTKHCFVVPGVGDGTLAGARRLLAVALAGLVTWLVVMFGPGTTMIYQGAFATVIMLFVVLGAAVTRLLRAAVGALQAVHILDLIVIWLIR